jgi:hypothetical protein
MAEQFLAQAERQPNKAENLSKKFPPIIVRRSKTLDAARSLASFLTKRHTRDEKPRGNRLLREML